MTCLMFLLLHQRSCLLHCLFRQSPSHLTRFLPRLPFALCQKLHRLSCPMIPTVLPCLAPSSDIDRFQQVHQSALMTCLSFDLYFQLLLVTSATSDPFHPCLSRSEEHTSELQSRFDLVCR